MSEYIVSMKNIRKSFGRNQVLHGVDFQLKRGSIHALLGENGTGKTTLMNILGKVIPMDEGEIAIANGCEIAFIHQELALINDLNIYENLFLGCELKWKNRLNKPEMRRKAKEILDNLGVNIDPDTRLGELNASYKQVVEIARALMKNAKVIIMDEPTTSLTNVEIEHVFSIMRKLKLQGVSIIFISHKLGEVLEVCDSYTVMRDGYVIKSDSVTPALSERELAKYMVGKELTYDTLYEKRVIGQEVLRTENLSRPREFRNISFHVQEGEIVGFTGLLGDGRSEVFQTIYGCAGNYEGSIFVKNQIKKMRSVSEAHKNQISYLPRNRKENGIIKDLSVKDNMSISILPKMCIRGPFIHKKTEQSYLQENIVKLKIKVDKPSDMITSLSGGNQQKVLLAKVLSANPKLVILDNPTQGVDVGAKLEIYEIIMKLAKQGISFVILSSEAQEILILCDRIYVMFQGEIQKELHRNEATEEKIMILATGGKLEEAE